MSWTLETAKQHLEAWLAAELAVSTGQSYKIGPRELVRANITEIRQQITFWRNEVNKLSYNRRGARVMRVVPRD
ncbi:DUF6148 family protein [Paenibacillus sp. TAB 01]|uniref:DUF6148 family protein n=1 Tax=Paenibacillus sp. TAB 01 TaxID=3368988 RepID=UPI003751164F